MGASAATGRPGTAGPGARPGAPTGQAGQAGDDAGSGGVEDYALEVVREIGIAIGVTCEELPRRLTQDGHAVSGRQAKRWLEGWEKAGLVRQTTPGRYGPQASPPRTSPHPPTDETG
ncbi:hypothetical protein [Streptomyces capparidis]